jgi:hypothetical protein
MFLERLQQAHVTFISTAFGNLLPHHSQVITNR